MNDLNFSADSMEELLTACRRSIVAPSIIAIEVKSILSIMSDYKLERKYIVEGCETLSLLASSFIRSGYGSFTAAYACKTGLDHWVSGFANKDQLIQYCEFCVEHGSERLCEIKTSILRQLEIENGMTKEEIYDLNRKKLEMENLSTVQEQITNYIKLSLLVSSLKEFFKKYYQGLN